MDNATSHSDIFFKITRPILCSYCAEPYECLCDFPTADGGTCDKPICKWHSVKGDTDTQDFCSCHVKGNTNEKELDTTIDPDFVRA